MTIEENAQLKSFLKRLTKGFVAGVVSYLSVSLTQIPVTDFTKQDVLLTLLVGAIAGGLLGVEKMLSWKDEV